MKSKMRVITMLLSILMLVQLPACQSLRIPADESGTTFAVGWEPVDEGTGADIEAILENMTLQEKIGQMMIVSYRIWKEVPATEGTEGDQTVENSAEEIPAVNVTALNDEIRAALKDYHFGGTLLYAENFRDAEQTIRLIADIQKANQEGGGLPLLVAADQEGGSVTCIGFGTTGVGNMALAATGDPKNAKQMAAIYGKELNLLGINTDFAPVMDVNNNPSNPIIGVRSFSDDPEVVAEFGLSYLEGLHDAGTIATLKHFPGHGNTDTDSHTAFPCMQSTYEELRQFELVPFQRAIDAGADMVMTAHIQYPQIEEGTYTSVSTGEQVYLPATMSHTILTDILRKDMGFEGVVVSDALDMAAVSANFETEDILTLSINAGVDMLILPIITDSELFQKTHQMVDTAVKLAEEGKIDQDRIDESVRRILTLKEKYGLLEEIDYSVTEEQINAAENGVGSAQNREASWNIANMALTLVKNEENVFPLKAESGQSTLILFANSCANRVGTGDLAKQKLIGQGSIPEDSEITILVNTADNEEECVKQANEADHVILIHRTYSASNLDPNADDGFSSAVFDRIIRERHAAGKKVILISCSLPYDAARFGEADAILLTYHSTAMKEIPPETGTGSAYVPNLAAALCACFGDGEMMGQLPVDIPQLDVNYQYTDQILYEKSISADADR